MNKHFLEVQAAIFEMGLLFNQPPGEQRIEAYAKALSRFTPAQIRYAFNQIIRSGGAFFPSLAEILKTLEPKELSSEEVANTVANEVIQAVIDFGIYRIQEAFDSLSETSKQTLGDNRYLLIEIANSERDQLPTIRAQIRGMVKAANENRKNSKDNESLQRLGIDTSKVISFSDKMKSMKRIGFDSEGA